MHPNKMILIKGLKESDAYPADPEDGYGWENFLAKECRHFTEDFGLETRVARYHNIYGPLELLMEEEKKQRRCLM